MESYRSPLRLQRWLLVLFMTYSTHYQNLCHVTAGNLTADEMDHDKNGTVPQEEPVTGKHTWSSQTIGPRDNMTYSGSSQTDSWLTETLEYSSTSATEKAVSQPVDYVGYAVVPTLLFISVLGNAVTVFIMNKRPFNRLPGGILLTSLAICDMSVALMLPLNRLFVRHLLGRDLRAISKAGCNFFFWFFRTMKMMSSWIVVLISVERFVSVWFGILAKVINTRRNALVGILVCFSIISTYNAIWSSIADVIINGVCIPNTKPQGYAQTVEVFLVIGLSIYCFIPSAAMIVLNALLLYKLSTLRRQPSGQERFVKKEGSSRPTAILIGVVVAFIVLVMPVSIAHLVFFARKSSIFNAQGFTMTVFREVSLNMEQLNYSLNFFLYIFCSKGYRNRFLQMVNQLTGKGNAVHPTLELTETRNSNVRTMQTLAVHSPGKRPHQKLTQIGQGEPSTIADYK